MNMIEEMRCTDRVPGASFLLPTFWSTSLRVKLRLRKLRWLKWIQSMSLEEAPGMNIPPRWIGFLLIGKYSDHQRLRQGSREHCIFRKVHTAVSRSKSHAPVHLKHSQSVPPNPIPLLMMMRYPPRHHRLLIFHQQFNISSDLPKNVFNNKPKSK